MKKKLSFIIEIIIGIIFICFGYFVIDTDYYATLFYAMGFGLAFASGVQLLKICYYEMPKNKEKLHELAAFLLERETITGEEFMRLLNSEADVIETSATVVKEGEADAEEASSI
jgi:multisubunit Na+/H+ antiporter MnhB subunit